MARIPVALQLFSIREECERDLPGALSAVAKMGYEGVEFAGYYGRSAQELRRLLDDLGLKVAGTHTGQDTLRGDQLARTIEFNQILGNRFLIVPWADPTTEAAWAAYAAELTQVQEKLRPLGMHTGYHNHDVEFTPLDGGKTAWDILAANSSPDVVMQLDIGNAIHGGGDARRLLEQYADRALTIHLKEYSATKEAALVGEGDVNWLEVFRICEAAGKTEWYIIEQESYPYPPMESVARALENVRGMRK